MDLTEFKKSIKHKDIENNRTYLYTTYKGCKYGQSYPNATNTLEGMINDFAIFYYPFIEDDRKFEYNYTGTIDMKISEVEPFKEILFSKYGMRPTIKFHKKRLCPDYGTMKITLNGYSLSEKSKNVRMFHNALNDLHIYSFNFI